jgi:hypothetical protein
LSSYLVTFWRGLVLSSVLVTLRGLVLVLRFEGLDKVTEHKLLCLLCIDDSSMILLFPLHMFSVNNFSVKLFSDS